MKVDAVAKQMCAPGAQAGDTSHQTAHKRLRRLTQEVQEIYKVAQQVGALPKFFAAPPEPVIFAPTPVASSTSSGSMSHGTTLSPPEFVHSAAMPTDIEAAAQASMQLLSLGMSMIACQRAIDRNVVVECRNALTHWLTRAPSCGLQAGFVVAALHEAMLMGDLTRTLRALEQLTELPLVPINNCACIVPDATDIEVARTSNPCTTDDVLVLPAAMLSTLLSRPSGLGVLYNLILHFDMLQDLSLGAEELLELASRCDGDEALYALGHHRVTLWTLGFDAKQARALLFASSAARKIKLAIDTGDLIAARGLTLGCFVELATEDSIGVAQLECTLQQIRHGQVWAVYSDQGR